MEVPLQFKILIFLPHQKLRFLYPILVTKQNFQDSC